MFKPVFELIRSSFLLTRDVQENRKDIEDVRRELGQVEEKLHQLALLIQEERHARKKMALQLENLLLRRERRLPPGKPPKDRN